MNCLLTFNKKLFKSICIIAVILFFASPVRAGDDSLVESLKKHSVSIHWEDVELSLLFKAMQRQSGITIYVADNIDDTISIEMPGRTLYDVLQLVMEAKNLRYFEKNGLLFIQKEEDYISKGKDIVIERLCTKFGSAVEYKEQLEALLSEVGSISVADRGNCLVIRDRVDNLARLKTVLAELDQPIPQVYIEAQIVVISQEAKKRLGIKWGAQKDDTDVSIDPSLAGVSSNITVGFIRDNINLNVELQALQEDDQLRILSSPRILVLDGKEAEIKQGKEIAYVTQTDNTINTSFREANLGLKVTPRILKDQYILLDLSVNNDSISTATAGGQPTIDTQEIKSTLFLENGVTVVIGGITLENNSNKDQQIPGLGGLPLLGHLFKSKSDSSTIYELQVFITPTIVPMREGIPYYADKKTDDQPKKTVAAEEIKALSTAGPEIASPSEEPAASSVHIKTSAERKILLIEENRPKKIIRKIRTEKNDAQKHDLAAAEESYLYSVQVGSFLLKEDAEQMLTELQAKGYSPFLAEFKGHDNRSWYTVRIGKFDGWTAASATASEFIKNEKKPGVVRPQDSL